MLCVADSVKVSRSGELRALFCADSGATTLLNQSASMVWEGVENRLTPEQIASRLAKRYEVSAAQALADTSGLLAQLERQGFVGRGVALAAPAAPSWPLATDGPAEVDICITGRCNAACGYCSYAPQMSQRPDLPTEAWLAFARELGQLPTRSVCLSGGEALLRPDLWDIVDAFVEQRLRFTLLTNGSLLDERAVEQLLRRPRRRRLDTVQVSLDGSSADVHERTRGPGSFAPAVAALRLLREAQMPVTCRVTVNHCNVDDLERTARLLLEDIGLPRFSTNAAMPVGSGRGNSASTGLTGPQRLRAMRTLAALQRRYPGRITAMAGPLAEQRQFEHMRLARDSGAPGPLDGRLTACGCVFRRMAVLHDGAMVPCSLLPQLHMGRINRDSLSAVWRDNPHLRRLRERRTIPLARVAGCEGCEWSSVCNGGCPALAAELNGDINAASPQECYRLFLQETRTHGAR